MAISFVGNYHNKVSEFKVNGCEAVRQMAESDRSGRAGVAITTGAAADGAGAGLKDCELELHTRRTYLVATKKVHA